MKQTTLRILTGIILLTIGFGALLGSLNLIPFWEIFSTWWPTLVIAGGLIVIAGDPRKNSIWGIAMLVIGGLLLFKTLALIDFNFFSLIVPIVIISVALSILFNVKNRQTMPSATKDVDDIAAILSGTELRNTSKDYKGGKLTAVFGGVVLDLRDAQIKSDTQIDLFVFCGGVEIRVPRNWKVVSKAIPIAGGVENKSEGGDEHKGPTLVLTGTVSLGGVEIKT